MGAGRSPASRAGGGGRSAAIPPQQVTPPTPQQVAQGNVLPNGGVAYDEFLKMSDDDKADVVADALQVGLPLFLDDSPLQRLAYFTGMSDKPTMVDDSALDSMRGQDIFRTVHDTYNSSLDIGYSATEIYKQIAYGDFTMYSDSGGSAYGRGIYFADSFRESSLYQQGAQNKNWTMRAKITSGKTISTGQLTRDFSRALNAGDKLANACDRFSTRDSLNLYALAKGYSAVIDGSSGYHMILNRGCLTMSKTTKRPNSGGSW